MARLSAISREFTSQSHDKAVFWIEHVAKFGGAPHLRPSTADATLFEYFCFDVITVILVFILTVLYCIRLVSRVLGNQWRDLRKSEAFSFLQYFYTVGTGTVLFCLPNISMKKRKEKEGERKFKKRNLEKVEKQKKIKKDRNIYRNKEGKKWADIALVYP